MDRRAQPACGWRPEQTERTERRLLARIRVRHGGRHGPHREISAGTNQTPDRAISGPEAVADGYGRCFAQVEDRQTRHTVSLYVYPFHTVKHDTYVVYRRKSGDGMEGMED